MDNMTPKRADGNRTAEEDSLYSALCTGRDRLADVNTATNSLSGTESPNTEQTRTVKPCSTPFRFVRNKSDSAPSRHEYGSLADAFDYFNQALFSPPLPQVLITLNQCSKH